MPLSASVNVGIRRLESAQKPAQPTQITDTTMSSLPRPLLPRALLRGHFPPDTPLRIWRCDSLNDLLLFQAFKKRFFRGAGHTSRCMVESTELRPS